jgi:hypothetical protein
MGTAVPFCFVLAKGNKVRKTKGMGDLTKPKVKKTRKRQIFNEVPFFFNFVALTWALGLRSFLNEKCVIHAIVWSECSA